MPLFFIPSILSSHFTRRKPHVLSSKINAVLLLSLTTLTACGGGGGGGNSTADNTIPPPVTTPSDTVGPIITLKGESVFTISAGSAYAELGATANDAIDGSVSVTRTGTVDSAVVNSYTLTYTATDAASNQSSLTRTVNVVDDIAPVLVINGETPFTFNAGDVYVDAGVTASDNIDEASTITVTTTGEVNSAVIASYTITYTATDASGNEAIPVARTVIVADLAGPVITLNGDETVEHNFGDVYTDLGATATDAVDGIVTATTSDTINIDMINSYGITYTAIDAAGNESALERIVNVVDLAAPVITLNGGNAITLGLGRDYNELGAIAVDNFDGEMVLPSPTGVVDNTTAGQYLLTYTATDTAGNTTTLVRTIEVVARPFITTWKTDNTGVSNDNEITITTNSAYTSYNYTVDWGDGSTTTNATGDVIHTYDTIGTYTVTIQGDFPQTYFNVPNNDSDKLLTVEQWGDYQWLSMNSAFYGCANLVINATDTPNVNVITDMSQMFQNATSFNQDISAWDVSTVTDMSNMFAFATSFNQTLGAWDVSAVTDMSGMFRGASSFNQTLSAWDVRVSAVTDMKGMFQEASSFNQEIGTWDVSVVTDMSNMFNGASAFNKDISDWNVSAVTDMSNMFFGATSFNQALSAWDTRVSAVTDMSWMFQGASSFNQNISGWDVSAVTDMSFMFQRATSFNQVLSTWNVGAVTDMGYMFRLSSFNQDISEWDIRAVTNMGDMFTDSPLSTVNFDALLQVWSGLVVQSNVILDGGGNAYSASSQAARDILTDTYGWTINNVID
jgi:surface protein